MAERTKKKTANLLSLNDKCLEKIFRCLHFEGLNLVKAFEDRLDPIFRNALIKGNACATSDMENFEEIVQNYGPQLAFVDVSDNVDLNLLAEYCVEGRLRHLRMFEMSINDLGLINRSKAMLSQLELLHISECEISDGHLGRLLALCPQLKTLLYFDGVSGHSHTLQPLFQLTSETMTSLHIHFNSMNKVRIEQATVVQLLTKYPNLTECDISDMYQDIICRMLPKTKLLHISSENIGRAVALTELKSLIIKDLHIAHIIEVNNFLTMSSGLSYLNISCKSGQQIDSLLKAISTCTSMKRLELNLEGPFILGDLVGLAESLPLLRTFYLQVSGTGHSIWQQNIWLQFVDKAKKLSGLRILEQDRVARRPNFTEFTEQLRVIIGRREQNDRRFQFVYQPYFHRVLTCRFVGSHVFQRKKRM